MAVDLFLCGCQIASLVEAGSGVHAIAHRGKVAVVAGATRGAGRGIATMLGEAGATVYCSGRSVRGRPATGTRPETIEETAERVTACGGCGIAVQTDHMQPAQVEALFDKVRTESGRLDILINDIGGRPPHRMGEDVLAGVARQRAPDAPTSGRVAHCDEPIGCPLMLDSPGPGLVVEITDGDGFWYRGNIFYDLVKTSIIRLAFAMARELRKRPITALAVTPGSPIRGHARAFRRDGSHMGRSRKEGPALPVFRDSLLLLGRAITALAADPTCRRRRDASSPAGT